MSAGRNISDPTAGAIVMIASVILLGPGLVSARPDRRGGHASESFDPLGFPGDDSVITAAVKAAPRDSMPALQTNSGSAMAPRRSGAGFQVQFFATTDLAEAQHVQRRAQKELADSIRMEFETPYYKVRAGRFATRDKAETLLVRLRAMGYESAWVLPFRPPAPSNPAIR
ncbi:MAG: SPOR domain-containing protein [candidate division Zixibacteria bacterium]|nr:SPOR domain-containing protein [candidate division Zixibacteria bacterium]